MISKRFKYDAKPLLVLNQLQKEKKEQVTVKVNSKQYSFEEINCPICNRNNFENLAEKDRYGLFYPVVICKDCGLVLTNPRMNQHSYIQFYNEEYRSLYVGKEKPTDDFFKAQYNKAKHIYDFLMINNLVESKKSPYVLEIGCGAGGILHYFREKGFEIKGIDLGKEYINYGKEKHNLDLSYGTIDELKLVKKPDLIIYSHVMEHILDLEKELKKIKEISDKETLIYIEVPGLKNVHNTYKMDFLYYFQNAHTFHFSSTSLQNLFVKNGFLPLSVNEYIRSVFKLNLSKVEEVKINNDYLKAKTYILLNEKLKFLYPIRQFKFNRFLKSSVIIFLDILKIKGFIKTLLLKAK